MDYITPLILSICRKNNLSREESCDVFGQVSFLLLTNLDKIRSVDKLLQYVGTITVRESINVYRRIKLHEKAEEHAYDTLYDIKPRTPEDIYEYANKSEVLMKLMVHLNRREYSLIKALYLEGNKPKYSEIAKQLNIPESSIGPTRARALVKLNRLIKENNIEL